MNVQRREESNKELEYVVDFTIRVLAVVNTNKSRGKFALHSIVKGQFTDFTHQSLIIGLHMSKKVV